MATAAQITANQLNAQSSTGPRTEAGKETVSSNARVHGLAAKKFYLTEADKPVFAELHAALTKHYQPATDHERALLEELAEAKWRCRTARTAEAALLDITIKELRKADASLREDHALARMFADETLQKRMRLMMRYLNSAQRAADKIRAELEEVIAVRRDEERRQHELEALRNRAERMAAMGPSQPRNCPDSGRHLVQNKADSPQQR